jgi:Kef-type K+ transport system membrane component KefB
VLRKLRKSEPMSPDELALAEQVVDARRSPMAYSLPAAFFTAGCFYVFGSLEYLHGAPPSERTFLGVIPMITSTNILLRLIGAAKLKRRLRTYVSDIPNAAHVDNRVAV